MRDRFDKDVLFHAIVNIHFNDFFSIEIAVTSSSVGAFQYTRVDYSIVVTQNHVASQFQTTGIIGVVDTTRDVDGDVHTQPTEDQQSQIHQDQVSYH